MAWTSYEEVPTIDIAREDIKVFKIVNYHYGAVYNKFQYELGNEYELGHEINIEAPTDWQTWRVYEGFHSYLEDKMTVEMRDIFQDGEYRYTAIYVYDNEGKPYDTYSDNHEQIVLECIVPKGAIYYLNEQGHIVSDKIKIIGKKKDVPRSSKNLTKEEREKLTEKLTNLNSAPNIAALHDKAQLVNEWLESQAKVIGTLSKMMNGSREELINKIKEHEEYIKEQEETIANLKKQLEEILKEKE